MIKQPPKEDIERVIIAALAEDLGARGDITSDGVVPAEKTGVAKLIAKAEGVLAGLDTFFETFRKVEPKVVCDANAQDGDIVSPGQHLATITGPARALLTAERTALNILGRLSGIASYTRRYVQEIEGTSARILDTRKTTPGLRTLEKYAVAVGGGTNHRIGLFDAFLIKENHIAMAGGITKAVKAANAYADLPVQVEVTNLDELREAIECGADSVLLDNMTPAQTKEAVALARELAGEDFSLESSGGINLDNVRAYAETGVDRISIGALTHSVMALDLSLLLEFE